MLISSKNSAHFSIRFNSALVSASYEIQLKINEDVPDEIRLDDMENKHPRITKRFETYFDRWHVNEGKFEHHKPASHLQKERDRFEDQIDEETLDRFENLFLDFNSVIESES